jgi:tetratricopeptide (TPR) repeat protein
MPPPNPTSPARRRSTGVAPAAGGPNRARRPTGSTSRASTAGQKLVCTAGPNSGEEYPLDGDEVVIGRSAENAIAIPDTSVSRKHVLLRRTPDGWAASDMGSGNGTMVNSNSIAEETVLSNGDVIAMGDTELQYVDEGSSLAGPARRNSTASGEPGVRRPVVRSSRARNQEDPEAKAKRSKLMIRIGAVLVLLFAGLVGYKIVQARRLAASLIAAAELNKQMDQLRSMNQQGRNLIRDGKWAEAKAIFEQLLALNPNFGGGTVQPYIAKCDQEIPNEEHLIKADELIKKGQVAAAFAELGLVSTDTLQADRREKVRMDLDAKIDAKLLEARELINATDNLKKMEELVAICDDVLAVHEDHRDAKEFKETAEKAIDRIKNPYVAPPAPKTPWVAVQQQFANGDQSGALALANNCAGGFPRCKALMGEIQEFNEKNKRLESMGPSELWAMLELDRRITGGSPSVLARPISVRAVAQYLTKASSMKAKGDWGQAAEYASKAIYADPNNVPAQSILSEARKAAQDTYLRAYQIKDQNPEEAIVLFKQVIQMTPSDNEHHQKAKRQLDTLKQ